MRIWESVAVGLSVCLLAAGCGGGSNGEQNDNQNGNQNQVSLLCGNGSLDGVEECDDGPLNSDTEPDACRTNCQAAHCGDSVPDTGEECDNGVQNSDIAPNSCRVDCAFPSCGDGVIDTAHNETCDDGNVEPGDGCSHRCWTELCGNGVVDPGEQCDDANHEDGDGCSANCASNESCGNGLVDPGEVCDDGDNDDGDGCRGDCQSNETCGNGLIDSGAGETCDDGGVTAGDGCGATCQLEYCGNGVVDPGEVCDDGNEIPGDDCSVDCRSDETCGNGYLDGFVGEQCDDSNNDAGDGCSPICELEYCGNGVLDPGEVCDDGNYVSGDNCSADCLSLETCGNGYVDIAVGEQCDDASQVGGDGCGPTCLLEYCGNGYVDVAVGEVCDDGNNSAGDGCSVDCRSEELCGDGILNTAQGEECDDANHKSHDGCSSGCTLETRQWVRLFPATSPPGRRGAGLVYDSLRGRFVLFGGVSGAYLDDTWAFDGVTWEALSPAQPFDAALNFASFYDPLRDQIVMLGGQKESSDPATRVTWVFEGDNWVAYPPPTYSGAVWISGMTGAYDGNAQEGYACCGRDNQGLWRTEKYAWNGTGWGAASGSVSPGRTAAAAAYSSYLGAVFVFGGYTTVWLTDFHAITGGAQAAPAASGTWSSMAADDSEQSLILYAWKGTWSYDGVDWTSLDNDSPPGVRWGQSMVYDPLEDRILMFGGTTSTGFSNQTWAYRWQSAWPEEICDNGLDDDGDGFMNCADADCENQFCATGRCLNGTCQ